MKILQQQEEAKENAEMMTKLEVEKQEANMKILGIDSALIGALAKPPVDLH